MYVCVIKYINICFLFGFKLKKFIKNLNFVDFNLDKLILEFLWSGRVYLEVKFCIWDIRVCVFFIIIGIILIVCVILFLDFGSVFLWGFCVILEFFILR